MGTLTRLICPDGSSDVNEGNPYPPRCLEWNTSRLVSSICPPGFIPDGIYCQSLLEAINEITADLLNAQTNALSGDIQTAQATVIQSLSKRLGNLGSAINSAQSTVLSSVERNSDAISQDVQQSKGEILNSVDRALTNINAALSLAENGIQSSIDASSAQIETDLRDAQSNVLGSIERASNQAALDLALAGQSIIASFNTEIDSLEGDITDAIQSILRPIGQGIAAIDFFLSELPGAAREFIDGKIGDLQGLLADVQAQLGETLQERLDALREIVRKVVNEEYGTWDELYSDLDSVVDNPSLLMKLLIAISFLAMIGQISTHVIRPFMVHLEHLAQEQARGTLLDGTILIQALRLGLVSEPDFKEELAKQGLADHRIQTLLGAAKNFLNPDTIRQLFLRKFIPRQVHDEYLLSMGFTNTDVERLHKVYPQLPPIQDVIRMAVRDVFSEDIVKEFRLKDDLPDSYMELAKQVGLSEQSAEWYWMAHWSLPSIQQAFEMIHRGVITDDQLDILFKAADVLPFWRDKLKAIAFRTYTRVDIRRMYELGVLDRNDVYRSMLDIGYSPERAENMTEFYVRYAQRGETNDTEEIRSLSRSLIVRAFVKGIIEQSEALARLDTLGYTPADANLILEEAVFTREDTNAPDFTAKIRDMLATIATRAYRSRSLSTDDTIEALQDAGYGTDEASAILSLVDIEYQLDIKEEYVRAIKQQYAGYRITQIELREALELYDFTPVEVLRIVDEIQPFRNLRDRNLSRADLRKANQQSIISDDLLVMKYRQLGYADDDIAIIMISDGNIPKGI